MYADDTIVAISTPHGAGGIGIVRVSGSQAVAVASRVFRRRRAEPAVPEPHRLYRGVVLDGGGEVIDTALGVFMYGPHSYTGEDVVEFHCHGSPLLLRSVVGRCCEAGARLAAPGEFTKRAFLNGRLDLVQAEAVAEVVTARTEAAARVGVRHLSGRLSGALAELREKLVAVKARAELLIDFPEEEAGQAPQELVALLGEVAARTDALLGSFRFGRLVREGLHVAIVGRPNVGKSSVLNALLGAERAIVTEVPGTTRDVIEESVDMDGIPVVLADTAGVRNETDMIERLGIERALEKARSADGTIVVLDRSEPMNAEDERVLQATAARPRVIAVNKCDLPARWLRRALAPAQKRSAIEVSAKTGAGIPELRQHLARAFEVEGMHTDEPVLTLVRHRDALAKALEAVAMARRGLGAGDTIDVVAVDIQEALEQIGEITGAVTSEDVLDRIFREFCIGK